MDWSSLNFAGFNGVYLQHFFGPEDKRNHNAILAAAKDSSAMAGHPRSASGRPAVPVRRTIYHGRYPGRLADHRWFQLDAKAALLEHPNVRAWYERLAARPAYQEHVIKVNAKRTRRLWRGAERYPAALAVIYSVFPCFLSRRLPGRVARRRTCRRPRLDVRTLLSCAARSDRCRARGVHTGQKAVRLPSRRIRSCSAWPVIKRALAQVKQGRGIALVRGLPREGVSEQEFELMTWALGLHTGVARPQGRQTHYISGVREAARIIAPAPAAATRRTPSSTTTPIRPTSCS